MKDAQHKVLIGTVRNVIKNVRLNFLRGWVTYAKRIVLNQCHTLTKRKKDVLYVHSQVFFGTIRHYLVLRNAQQNYLFSKNLYQSVIYAQHRSQNITVKLTNVRLVQPRLHIIIR